MFREMFSKVLGYFRRFIMFTEMLLYLRRFSWRAQTSNDSVEGYSAYATCKNTATARRMRGGFKRGQKQLLPGIPDEITLNHITPKLPWKTFLSLSSVSRAWKNDIRSRQVYDLRVRSHSTETVVLINHFRSEDGKHSSIGLYSLGDRLFHQIPGIPHLEWGIPRSSQCISMDGKIYVLGGLHDGTLESVSDKVYVMDLAGQGQWEPCASMKYARRNFGCGVLDGRIYVCGGFSVPDGVGPECLGPAVFEPEIYDPKLDVWSPIKSMTSVRANDQVTAWGDELLLFKGQMFNPDFLMGEGVGLIWTLRLVIIRVIYVLEHYCFEAYSPVRNEWRNVQPYALGYQNENVFVANGKFHSMDMERIYVYDFDRNSRAQRHSFSFAAIESEFPPFETWATLLVNHELVTFLEGQHLQAENTLVVNNELVSIVSIMSHIGGIAGPHLVQSTGFGSREERITWHRADCPFQMKCDPLMCTLQL